MRAAAALCVVSLSALGQPTPEHQLALTALQSGEKERLEKVLGPIEEQPLYRAAFDIDPENRKVNGTVVITYFARSKPLDMLYLRVSPNADRPGLVKLVNVKVNGAPVVLEQPEPTLYRVKLDPVALPGTGAIIEARVVGRVPEAPQGSDTMSSDPGIINQKKADYGAFLAAPEVMSLTGLIPTVVPQKEDGTPFAGPTGLGDLSSAEPAQWLVSVEVPRTHAVVAGGNTLGEIPRPDDRVRYSFGHAGARDFPIFVTRGYGMASRTVGEVTIESHYVAADEKAGKRVADYAADALADFQRRFGPYPYKHLRVIEARLTDGAGGMEFPGIVSVGTSLYRGTADPLAALGLGGSLDALGPLKGLLKGLNEMMEATLEFTVAHEVAHQYFAMLVGNDPIAEPAADEPLTQHAALLYLEARRGKTAANAMRDAQLKMAYQFFRLTGGRDGTCERGTADFDTTGEYAALIYGKAPLLFDAVRKQLGDAAYAKALRAYVDENRYRWASTNTVFQAFAKAAPGSKAQVEKLRKHWWQEKNGDKDIGTGELGKLLTGMDPAKGGAVPDDMLLDPQTRQLLEEAIRQLGGMGP